MLNKGLLFWPLHTRIPIQTSLYACLWFCPVWISDLHYTYEFSKLALLFLDSAGASRPWAGSGQLSSQSTTGKRAGHAYELHDSLKSSGRGMPFDWHFEKSTQSDKDSPYSDLRWVTHDCSFSLFLLDCLCTSTPDHSVHLSVGKWQIHL